jgi:pilus assembly protein Flp/PilA
MQGLRRAIVDAAACGRRFLADDAAATAIEYGVLVSGIAVAIIVSISALGTGLRESLYDAIVAAIQSRN